MPSQDKFVPNNVWATAAPAGQGEEKTLPSGQTCLAKKIDIDGMVESGILADVDILTAQVSKHTRKVRGAKDKPDGEEFDQKGLMADPEGMKSMIKLMDKTLPHIVMDPVVKLHFTEKKVGKTTVTKMIPLEDREPGVVYTDQVGFEDKVDLFNWAAGGLQTMLKFRQ